MARQKKPVHKVQMTEGKRNIIHQLLEEYDIQSAEDIQEALKDLLGGTIKEMMDAETWITADEAIEYGFATEIVEDAAKQSLQDGILAKLVLKNKELEKQLQQKQEPSKKGWFF